MENFDDAMRRLNALANEFENALVMDDSPERTAILRRIANEARVGSIIAARAKDRLARAGGAAHAPADGD